jgi:thiol:disulfide interchange protein DsbC
MSEATEQGASRPRRRVVWLLAIALAIPGGYILAEQEQEQAPADTVSTTPEAAQLLLSRLQALRPDLPIERVAPAPMPGMFQLELTGGTSLYGTADGRYLFAGDLYEVGEADLLNLTERSRTAKRVSLMAAVKRDDMVIFSPEGGAQAAIAVFTDVDCGYCRKLHQEVPRLNELGIEVRYLAYPRAGVGSRSYQKIVSAWCAPDPNQAITRLKLGESIPDLSCSNPVADQFELGQLVGVTGTPAIVLEDGRLLPGYLPADTLAEAIGIKNPGP